MQLNKQTVSGKPGSEEDECGLIEREMMVCSILKGFVLLSNEPFLFEKFDVQMDVIGKWVVNATYEARVCRTAGKWLIFV